MEGPIYLAAALDGLGSHPAAWRQTETPGQLFDPQRIVSLAQLAEHGMLDLITLDDQVPTVPEPGYAHGALDAWLTLAQAAAHTSHLALFPTGVAHGEPAVMAGRAVTLDRIAGGRGGWRPRVRLTDDERRRATADPERYAAFTEERFAQADAFVGEVTACWGTWPEEPGGSPDRHGATGDRLRTGGHARVPTAMSGSPLTAVLAHFSTPYRLAARHADIVFITPFGRRDVVAIREELAKLCTGLRKGRAPLAVLADLDVVLGGTDSEAAERRRELDQWIPYESDAAMFTGTPEKLAELLEEWHRDGGVDGFRIRPAVLSRDLTLVVEKLVPLLQERGLLKATHGLPLRTRILGEAI
ncbi:LLM class flavin-dependent oxidoreductase [Streptomyces bauhiniae]